jgi:hypothetical protein
MTEQDYYDSSDEEFVEETQNESNPRTTPRRNRSVSFNPAAFSLFEDGASEDEEEDEESRRLRLRQEAIDSIENLTCMDCELELWQIIPPRLRRSDACRYQETVSIPCCLCRRLVQISIRY